ncbi:MAG: DUF4097 family beta strand repeat protein [candidate division WOR-3 bacterium]|nr:MAG: DUF4097 family beta strand repeat protein [candidate division WOR-3 bacterium]
MKKGFMVFVCAVLLVLTCTSEDDTGDYELQHVETRMWPSSGISVINAITVNGEIAVSATPDTLITAVITRSCTGSDSLDAEEHIDDIAITESIAGGELTLEADMPDTNDRDYRADFDFTAPADRYLDITTLNGDVSLYDMTAGATVLVTNGGITTDNMQGSVAATIVNGAIYCDMEEFGANETILLTTTNGMVTLLLPADVRAEFDASTTNGEITISGFNTITYTINEVNHKVGTLGVGSSNALINITVVNGNITIQAR